MDKDLLNLLRTGSIKVDEAQAIMERRRNREKRYTEEANQVGFGIFKLRKMGGVPFKRKYSKPPRPRLSLKEKKLRSRRSWYET